MTEPRRRGRLATFQAALIIARRDFVAILFSRAFIFFSARAVVVGGDGVAGGAGGASRRRGRRRPW